MPEFSDQRFPIDISFAARGGPQYLTDISTTAGGVEYRNSKWFSARNRYNIAHGLTNLEQILALQNFFRVHKGRAIGFRYKDWSDFQAFSEQIAIADGKKKDFQLTKRYQVGELIEVRQIQKPVAGSVNVYVDGELMDVDVDYSNGIVSFENPPLSGKEIIADFEFDVPVRFDSDLLSLSLNHGNTILNQEITLIEIK
jgi:uncharacterized protein (TIGR02217 family)